jgi:REP-associated tyrosine transposase
VAHSAALRSDSQTYLLTVACYEHAPIIGKDATRREAFERKLLEMLQQAEVVHAWVILPNHYHSLVYAPKIDELLKEIGLLHGRTAYEWNGEDGRRGRKVWFNSLQTAMTSERHFSAFQRHNRLPPLNVDRRRM